MISSLGQTLNSNDRNLDADAQVNSFNKQRVARQDKPTDEIGVRMDGCTEDGDDRMDIIPSSNGMEAAVKRLLVVVVYGCGLWEVAINCQTTALSRGMG